MFTSTHCGGAVEEQDLREYQAAFRAQVSTKKM